jgi:hypothetical protein
MPLPRRLTSSRWIVGLALLVCLASPGAYADDPTATRIWSAREQLGRNGTARPTELAGQPAVELTSAAQQHICLEDKFPAKLFRGAFTVRIVFQLPQLPQGKSPLVSKWKMVRDGRSFELGVFPSGDLFFDVSPTGVWDSFGRELISNCFLEANQTYCLAALFEPGRRMQLFVNGHLVGELKRSVPEQVFAAETPLWLGAQPPGGRHIDAFVSQVMVDSRAFGSKELNDWAKQLQLDEPPRKIESPLRHGRLDLPRVRQQVMEYCAQLQVDGEPYGVLRERRRSDAPTGLYPSADVAWIRACMGEDLRKTLTDQQRREWIQTLNSYARSDGTYFCPRSGHSLEHANGMVIGALAVLGGRQPYRVSLYDQFNSTEKIEPWLDAIQWDHQWGASHLFWGGMHCYSMSRECEAAWLDRVFDWLDDNLNPNTGWWRKGVPQAGRRIEVLGGAAHIWPIYQHHQRKFPYPQKIIDEILAMQQQDGTWISLCNYMELDALYGLAYMRSLVPDYRPQDIDRAVQVHGEALAAHYASFLRRNPTAHHLLACVGTIGLLQQLAPEDYPDDVRWSDIFGDRQFYRTDRVEARRAAP